jgi:hypothetical protein
MIKKPNFKHFQEKNEHFSKAAPKLGEVKMVFLVTNSLNTIKVTKMRRIVWSFSPAEFATT